MSELYRRQTELALNIPSHVTVIGVGGVGSWVALNLALTGVENIILVDKDKVEEHNLNRTPFTRAQVGMSKVNAVMELILERRRDCNVVVIEKFIDSINELNGFTIGELIDCRDTSAGLEAEQQPKITGGYDGHKITLHLNPKSTSVWGEGATRYTITPSWLVPPQLIANLITSYLVLPEERQTDREKVINFSVIEDWNRITIGGETDNEQKDN